MIRYFTLCLFIAVTLLTIPAIAQSAPGGSISGRVIDPSNSPVAGATISVKNTATGIAYSGTTTSDGLYVIHFLPPGNYTVTASRQGFRQTAQPNVIVDPASNPTVDLRLSLGTMSQTVTVSASTPLVDAQTADRGEVVDTVRMDNTPTQARNIFGLVFTASGGSPTSNMKSYTPYDNSGSSSFNINGSQGGGATFYGATNQMLIDGVDDRTSYNGGYYGLIPTQDSISEMKVVTNPYSAEYGRTTGGSIIAVTKSGTNEYHGSAFDDTRVTGLAANQFERNLAGQPRQGVHFWQPGVTIGGPIKKNKLFFFFDREDLYSTTAKSYVGTVPTQAQRTGDFSQTYYINNGQPALQVIYDPLSVQYNASTGQYIRSTPFPGNVIPANRINPVAGNSFWSHIPLPNSTGAPITDANNYIPSNNGNVSAHLTEWMPRVDYNINDTNRLTFRYTRNNFNSYDVQFYPGPLDPDGTNFPFTRANNNAVVDYTRTLSPTMVLDVRAGMERYFTAGQNNKRCDIGPAQLGFSATFVSEAVNCVPVYGFGGSTLGGSTNFTGAGTTSGNVQPDQSNTLGGDLSKSVGRHTIKLGAIGLLERYYSIQAGNNAGAFSFSPTATSQNPQVNSPASGNDVASFLVGVGSASIDVNSNPARQNKSFGAYVEDDISVTPKLKVNVGLRWDWDGGLTDRFNAMTGAFNTTAVSPLAAAAAAAAGASNCPACAHLAGGLTFPGINGLSRSPYDSSLRNFGPRLGAAYAFDSKTVIRAGWGLFYGVAVFDPGSAGYSQTTNSVEYNSNFTPATYIDNPFLNGLITPVGAGRGLLTNVGTGVSYVDPHAREPRSQQFSFDIQREVGWSTLLSAGYAYNGVSRLPVSRNINALTDAQVLLGSSVLNQQVTNPFAGLAPGFALNQATTSVGSLIVPYPQFTGVTDNDIPVGNAAYHALQLQATKRFSSGLSFGIAYTWSKHLGRYNYQPIIAGGSGSLLTNSGDGILQKSIDPYDIPRLLTINESYELPIGRNRPAGANMPRWLDTIVGGWKINGLIRLESGAPYLVAVNAIPVPGVNPNAPNQSLNQWINPAAFILDTNPYSVVGWSQSFDNLRLPWIHNLDLQAAKDIKVTERIKLTLMNNWINAFNTPQFWNGPGSCNSPSSSCFGKIAGYQGQTNLPRQIQFGGRITF